MKKYKIAFSLLLLILFSGCYILKNKDLKKVGSFAEETFSETIPFKYINGLIFIEVEIDNQPFNFIFDTGAGVGAVTPELLSKISYKKQSTIKVIDINNTVNRPITLTINSTGIGNTNFKDMWVISQDISAIRNYFACDIEVHGIIGSNLMRKAIWRIDYQNQQIEFKDLGKQFPRTNKTITIPMKCNDFGSAHIPLEIDGEKQLCTYDSGSTGFIQCSKKNISSIPRSKKTADLQSQTTGLYGTSVTKEVDIKTGMIKLGEIQLKKKIINFIEGNSSVIGNKFWSNFNVVIDWTNCQLQLEQVEEIKHETLDTFQYGLKFDIKNEKVSISNFRKTHSLYQPLDSDNQVVSIGKFELNKKMDLCSFMKNDYPLLLKQDTLNLVILEKGIKKEITLKKELLISE